MRIRTKQPSHAIGVSFAGMSCISSWRMQELNMREPWILSSMTWCTPLWNINIDDLLAKSYTMEGYLEILDKFFTWLEKFNIKFNPKKCVWVDIRKAIGVYCFIKGNQIWPYKGKIHHVNATTNKYQSIKIPPRKIRVNNEIYIIVGW